MRARNDKLPKTRMRSILRASWIVLGWLLIAFAAVVLGSAIWIRRTFGPISVDQMLMHLPGAGAAEPTNAEGGYISGFIWQAIVIPLAVVAIVAILLRLAPRARRRRGTRIPAVRPPRSLGQRLRVDAWWRPLVVVAACAASFGFFAQTTGIIQYLRSSLTSMDMADYYVAPSFDSAAAVSSGSGGKPKNLVLIFLESGEEAYSDESLFEVNMNAPLEEATEGWQKFEPLDVYDGGGWTMAGVVGTECGVPLRGPGIGVNDINSNEIGAEVSAYMPGADCLGDVLSQEGYKNVYLGGADAAFASKKNFLMSHGYDESKDLGTWQELGETEFSMWGLSDRRLMERAKEEVTALHETGQPFNLTMLTLDTHEPVPQFDYCPTETADPAVSAYRCSLAQVAGFVDYLREMGYLDDTAVFITGDHPKMLAEGGLFYDQLAPLDERPLFNRLWDPDGAEIERSSIDQLSVYGTLLDVLGLGRSDGRAGVGVSAFVSADSASGALGLSAKDYQTLIESRSANLYRDLWADDDLDDRVQAQAGDD